MCWERVGLADVLERGLALSSGKWWPFFRINESTGETPCRQVHSEVRIINSVCFTLVWKWTTSNSIPNVTNN
jgi:hypothetical protein